MLDKISDIKEVENMHYSCLIVDDEEAICRTTCDYFNLFDITSAFATSYDEAVSFLKENTVSMLILDVNLGERSGFALCKQLREEIDVPILFLSARNSENDILTALNIGGDDYITKPFSLNILLAKVKAILRRNPQITAPTEDAPEKTDESPIRLDYNYHQVYVNGQKVQLKEMEFKILSYMMERPNTVITKDEFFANIWGDDFISEGTLSVHIRRIRQKIETDPDAPEHLKTVWRVGYVWEKSE